jgi:hypothetical protein
MHYFNRSQRSDKSKSSDTRSNRIEQIIQTDENIK